MMKMATMIMMIKMMTIIDYEINDDDDNGNDDDDDDDDGGGGDNFIFWPWWPIQSLHNGRKKKA